MEKEEEGRINEEYNMVGIRNTSIALFFFLYFFELS